MVLYSSPSPLDGENKSGSSKKRRSTSKSARNRVSKRASAFATAVQHDHATHNATINGRRKRAWKACERCKMKKVKCDGELPCKRCKDDGLVCTAVVGKKVEHKQLPRGYAEVLENTQFALIATVHKLYSMVRNSQPWELGEPNLNDRGLPVIHDIAQKLSCIRPSNDIDLPVHSDFPEDKAGINKLARQLEEQQHKDGDSQNDTKHTDSSSCHRNDRPLCSELDHSDFEDYDKGAFGSGNAMILSPQNFTGSNDAEFSPVVPEIDLSVMVASQARSMLNFSTESMPKSQTTVLMMQFLQPEAPQNMSIMNQNVIDPDFGTIQHNVLSYSNPDVMKSMSDPMFYSGFDGEAMRL